jgi:hypothetical protein
MLCSPAASYVNCNVSVLIVHADAEQPFSSLPLRLTCLPCHCIHLLLLNTPKQTLNSSSGPLPTLRSHRSARPPPEICLEQALSHRNSLGQNPASPRADRAAAAQAPAGTTPAVPAAAGDKGAGVPTPSSAYFTPAATPQPTYAVAEGTEGTEGSSTCSEGEPARLVKLEWRNLCYAVKAASGLRLIVQVGRQQGRS